MHKTKVILQYAMLSGILVYVMVSALMSTPAFIGLTALTGEIVTVIDNPDELIEMYNVVIPVFTSLSVFYLCSFMLWAVLVLADEVLKEKEK